MREWGRQVDCSISRIAAPRRCVYEVYESRTGETQSAKEKHLKKQKGPNKKQGPNRRNLKQKGGSNQVLF